MGPTEALLVLLVLALAFGPPFFAYRDMKNRGQPDKGWVVVLAMVFVWPVGFVLWLISHNRYPRTIQLPPR